MEKVYVQGSLSTITEFKLKNKDAVRVRVTFKTECTVVNQNTYYWYEVYHRKYKARTFHFVPSASSCMEKRSIEGYLTEQQLYTAFFNHWETLNPLRRFSHSSINGVLGDFSVIPKELTPNSEISARYCLETITKN